MKKNKPPQRPLFRNHKKPVAYAAVLVLMVALYSLGIIQGFISSLHEFEYAGAFVAGIFYSYGMTTPFSIATLAVMAGDMDPFVLASLGAAGATLSNMLMFRSFSGRIGKTIRLTRTLSIKIPKARSLLHRAGISVLGGLILMSPLPDEVAIVAMGISRISIWKLAAISFVFKFAGVLAIAGISMGLHLSGS